MAWWQPSGISSHTMTHEQNRGWTVNKEKDAKCWLLHSFIKNVSLNFNEC
jgi:hypothetical protein